MSSDNELRAARTAMRMTQAHLALAAGMSERTVIRAEQGRPISAENLRSLCSVLGLDASMLQTADVDEDPLHAQVRALRETVTWTGAFDVGAWRRENAFGIWASLAVGATLANIANVAFCLSVLIQDADPWNSVIAALLLAGSAGAQAYVIGRVAHWVRLDRRYRNRRFVATRQALYVEDTRGDSEIRTTERLDLSRATFLASAPAYSLWPLARALRVSLPTGSRHIQGISDVESLLASVR